MRKLTTLKSSPENVVKKNILVLFKLPVCYTAYRDQATFKWATFSILA